MWKEGAILIKGKVYNYQAKVYGKNSEYGIAGGKISKVSITRGGITVARYDRGWDIEPQDEDTELALGILMKQYGE